MPRLRQGSASRREVLLMNAGQGWSDGATNVQRTAKTSSNESKLVLQFLQHIFIHEDDVGHEAIWNYDTQNI
jgi:hypothetical protein